MRRLRSTPGLLPGVAIAVLVVAVLVVGRTEPWDPLAGEAGVGLVLVAAFGLGIAVGRWSALAFAAVVLLMVPGTRAEEPFTFGFAVVVLLLPVCVVVLGIGVAARLDLRRGRPAVRPPLRGMPLAAASASLGVAVVGLAVGTYLDVRVVDRIPTTPRLVDDRTATIDGVGPRSSLGRVRDRLGTPRIDTFDAGTFGRPLDGPSPLLPRGSDAERTWRYRGVALLVRDRPSPTLRRTARGRRFLRRWRPVDAIVITDRDAQTPAGVGIGDSLELARRAYPGIRCDGIRYGSDSSNPGDPACGGRTRDGGGIEFAGDPITTIALSDGSDQAPLRP